MSGSNKEIPTPHNFDRLWNFSDPALTEKRFLDVFDHVRAIWPGEDLLCIQTQIARCQALQGKFDEAHRTLDTIEGRLTADGLARVRYLLERGRIFNDQGKQGIAAPLFLEAWTMAQNIGAEFFAVDAAHMLGVIGTLEESLKWNERALNVTETAKEERTRNWRCMLILNIGWAHHKMGQYERALTRFRESFECFQAKKMSGAVDARWCIARALRSLGKTEEALNAQLALLPDYQSSGRNTGEVLEEIGECYLALGNQIEAKKHFALAYPELVKDQGLAKRQPARILRVKNLADGTD